MSETITITGNVATDPTTSRTASGIPVTNFRVASNARRFDAATQKWVDQGTNWFSVAAFRQLGEHAKASLRLGDSVIISGRLKIRTWESNGKQGTSVDLDAEVIGHDLRWGTSAYLRARRAGASEAHTRPIPASGGTSPAIDAGSSSGAGAEVEAVLSTEPDDLDTSWATSGGEEAASAMAS